MRTLVLAVTCAPAQVRSLRRAADPKLVQRLPELLGARLVAVVPPPAPNGALGAGTAAAATGSGGGSSGSSSSAALGQAGEGGGAAAEAAMSHLLGSVVLGMGGGEGPPASDACLHVCKQGPCAAACMAESQMPCPADKGFLLPGYATLHTHVCTHHSCSLPHTYHLAYLAALLQTRASAGWPQCL